MAASVAQSELTPSERIAGRELGGFDFSNVLRNGMIAHGAASGMGKFHIPSLKKTGTTICGVVFKGGVVLGADTRATEGTVISDKNCEKIHYIAPNIYCCGAGTAADTEMVTKTISSSLELLRRATGCHTRVVTAMTQLKRHLFKYQGHVSAYLVLGGVDLSGPHLYTVYAHGSTDKLPYVTMGSGSLNAMAVMETGYKDDMTEEEAIDLVARSVRAGIFNDLGSGSNVDITVIKAQEGQEGEKKKDYMPTVTIKRNYQTPNNVEPIRALIQRPAARNIPLGATVVLRETFQAAGAKTAVTVDRSKGHKDPISMEED